MKKIGKRATALALSTVIAVASFGATGCEKAKTADDKYQSGVEYIIENGNEYKDEYFYNYTPTELRLFKSEEDAEYEMFVDIRELPDKTASTIMTSDMVGMSEEELEQTNYGIDYVYPTKTLKVTSENPIKSIGTGYTSMATGFFRWDYSKIYNVHIPDPYMWAKSCFGERFNDNLATIKYSLEELEGINGNSYLNINFKITFKKDIPQPQISSEFIEKYGVQEPIYAGDSLTYKALYRVDYYDQEKRTGKLIADKQTGMGSTHPSITDNIMNNYDEVYKSVASLGKEKETKSFESEEEFFDYIFEKGKERKR